MPKHILIKFFGDFSHPANDLWEVANARDVVKVILGQPMSHLTWQSVRMNIKRLFSFGLVSEQTVAVFGQAQLVKRANGRHELIGGTSADHFAAREWCSFFGHEWVFSSGPVKESSETAFAE